MAARMTSLEALDALIHDWFASHTFDEVARALNEHEVPHARVQSIADIVHDPQFAARKAIVRLPDPDAGSLPAPCIVPKVWPPAVSATVSSSSIAMRAKVSRMSRAEASGSGLPSGPSGLT